jgi:hypothetical protein
VALGAFSQILSPESEYRNILMTRRSKTIETTPRSMELTRDKLREAEFFFEKMKESVEESDNFRYYLSAFISAGRATTSVLQKEYSHIKIFEEWYGDGSNHIEPGTVQEYMAKDPLFRFMNELRVNTHHKEGLPLTTATLFTQIDTPVHSIEVLQDRGLPEPIAILETKDGTVLGSVVGYAWRVTIEDGNLTLKLLKIGRIYFL